MYWLSLGLLAGCWRWGRRAACGRTWGGDVPGGADDDVGGRAFGVRPGRYKGMGFAVSGLLAGMSGAVTASIYSYINHETFTAQVSILALTMVILGGMGNLVGAIVGAVALIGLPELFRFTAEYRILAYGIVLLLLVRFRPQGLFGTV